MNGQNTEKPQNTETDTEEIPIKQRAIRVNESMWGSYGYLSPIMRPGDYIIPLRLSNQGNGVWVLTFKVIRIRETEVAISE